MRERIWQFLVMVLVVGGVLTWRAAPAAQAQSPDVLSALLTEVRGLRSAMEQMASAGPRIQLATARLQLQEQRINTLVRRLGDVRATAHNVEEELAQMRAQLRLFEQGADDTPPSEAERIAVELTTRRATIGRREADLQRLQAEDAQVSQEIATEQGRWSEINQKLDELDRALTRK